MSDNSEEERKTGIKGVSCHFPQSIEIDEVKAEELSMKIKNTREASVVSPDVVSPDMAKTHINWLIEGFLKSL